MIIETSLLDADSFIQLHTVPKYTANVVLKSIRRHCNQYIEFAEVYENQNIEELAEALEKRRIVFVKVSGNTDIVMTGKD